MSTPSTSTSTRSSLFREELSNVLQKKKQTKIPHATFEMKTIAPSDEEPETISLQEPQGGNQSLIDNGSSRHSASFTVTVNNQGTEASATVEDTRGSGASAANGDIDVDEDPSDPIFKCPGFRNAFLLDISRFELEENLLSPESVKKMSKYSQTLLIRRIGKAHNKHPEETKKGQLIRSKLKELFNDQSSDLNDFKISLNKFKTVENVAVVEEVTAPAEETALQVQAQIHQEQPLPGTTAPVQAAQAAAQPAAATVVVLGGEESVDGVVVEEEGGAAAASQLNIYEKKIEMYHVQVEIVASINLLHENENDYFLKVAPLYVTYKKSIASLEKAQEDNLATEQNEENSRDLNLAMTTYEQASESLINALNEKQLDEIVTLINMNATLIEGLEKLISLENTTNPQLVHPISQLDKAKKSVPPNKHSNKTKPFNPYITPRVDRKGNRQFFGYNVSRHELYREDYTPEKIDAMTHIQRNLYANRLIKTCLDSHPRSEKSRLLNQHITSLMNATNNEKSKPNRWPELEIALNTTSARTNRTRTFVHMPMPDKKERNETVNFMSNHGDGCITINKDFNDEAEISQNNIKYSIKSFDAVLELESKDILADEAYMLYLFPTDEKSTIETVVSIPIVTPKTQKIFYSNSGLRGQQLKAVDKLLNSFNLKRESTSTDNKDIEAASRIIQGNGFDPECLNDKATQSLLTRMIRSLSLLGNPDLAFSLQNCIITLGKERLTNNVLCEWKHANYPIPNNIPTEQNVLEYDNSDIDNTTITPASESESEI